MLNRAVIDPLESRQLLSVSAAAPTLTDGVLSVTGTDGSDHIRISIAKGTTSLAVKVNGTVTLFSLDSVTKINVDALGSNDVIRIKQSHGGINIATELDGGDGNDKIIGGDGDDVISGGAGDDILRGNGGRDLISGGEGSDKIFGGRGNDSLLGDDGNDKLRGGGGNDVLDGGAGHNRLRGGGGMDQSLGHDVILDSNKNERSHRFARPNDSVDDGGQTDAANSDDDGAIPQIWWDPEANTDDSGNPIDVSNIY